MSKKVREFWDDVDDMFEFEADITIFYYYLLNDLQAFVLKTDYDRLVEINKVLVEALERAKMLNGYQAMTCLPINVREQDGSISQHRPKSIAGEINDILTEALAEALTKAKEMGK